MFLLTVVNPDGEEVIFDSIETEEEVLKEVAYHEQFNGCKVYKVLKDDGELNQKWEDLKKERLGT